MKQGFATIDILLGSSDSIVQLTIETLVQIRLNRWIEMNKSKKIISFTTTLVVDNLSTIILIIILYEDMS